MTREQVKSLFRFLVSVYPNFEVSTEKIDTWTAVMKDMDYDRVMAKARAHAQENKFPPTIAEISAYAPKKNDTFEKMRKWEEEASRVPQHVKDNFKRQIKILFEEKAK